MKKYLVLLGAMLINLLFGFQYTWAIFDRILIDTYGLSAKSTQFVFSSQVVTFALAFVFAGRIIDHVSTRVTTIAGALIYGGGLVLAWRGGPNPVTLVLGVGLCYGLGLALGYIGPLVTAVKWFPERKGLATGFVVGAFGSGSLFFSAAVKALIAWGMSMFTIFLLVGISCAAGIILLSFSLVEPPSIAPETERKAPLPPGLLRTRAFWSLVAGFLACTLAGLSIVGSLEKIGKTAGAPEAYLTLCVTVLALGNTTGRPGWGMITELIGTRRAVLWLILLQAAFIAAMIFLGRFGPAFVALSFLIGFNYGGTFVLYVTEVAKSYGPERVGSVYGLVFVVYAASGLLGPTSSGFSHDRWHSYVPSMAYASAVLVAGAIAFFLLYRRPADTTL